MNLFELFVKIGVKDEASGNLSKITDKLGNGLKKAAKIGTAAVSVASGAIVALTKQAVESYAEYEQLVGGVQTLFGLQGQSLEEYAAAVGKTTDEALDEWRKYTTGERKILNAAEDAYKTAGMSMNEYMETVTGFSASLIQSLGGDTAKAADYAHRAITDMSDNANKMGTDLEMIKTAYAGFSKQNYTMLDNLKLGYGGTKEEMQRLIKDASKLTDVQKELGLSVDANNMSFGNIVNAISVVQAKMGIMGTTAKEAGMTIAGSVGSMKAAWINLITGLADKNADIETLVENLVTTIVGDGTETNLGVFGNIMPAVKTALNGAATLIGELLPKIVELIPSIITENLPILASAAVSIIQALVDGISQNQEALMTSAMETIVFLANSLLTMLPQILKVALQLIVTLASGIADSLPELIPTIIDVVLQIVEILTDQDSLNKLLKAAFTIIKELSWGLVDNIDKIIDAVVTLVDGMIDFFLLPKNLAMFIETAVQLILAIGTGIIKAIPQLLVSVGTLIASIFANFFTADWGSIGTDLVEGLKQGISNAWNNLKEWFKGLFGDLIGIAKKILGIASPSKVFKRLGKWTAEGFGIGFDDEFSDVEDDIRNSMDFGDFVVSSGGMRSSSGASGRPINITQNIYAQKKSAAQLMQEARWQAQMGVLAVV